MNLSITDFQKISNGYHNAGDITLTGRGKLDMVNNHVGILKGWNTKSVSAATTLEVKNAFVQALKNAGVDEGALEKVRAELGLPQGESTKGFDMSSLKPLSRTQTAIKQYRLGMELEFEYSLVASVMADGRSGPDGSGSPTFYAADVPLLRSRVREYMQMYRDSGMYGQQPLAVYSGTDAWHQLASSTDEGDRAMLRDLCNFILDSPLKK